MYELCLIAILAIVAYLQYKQISKMQNELSRLKSSKQSLSTRYGQIFEQLIPFAEKFPFDIKNFRFIGSPIDGIAFENDRIVFCEVKLNSSRLTEKEKNIKNLVKNRKVEWHEMRG